MKGKTLFLVCNAHLDPVWLWEWEEGLAETLSTFRTAAHFCEEFEGFIFCHNEAILYQWVEEYEPELFVKIQTLVHEKKWHIMGGWYLQPDCNLPSGESFVRQILVGKNYFKEKFDVEPTTAVNLDPFGHTRGLVQILKKSGYNSYLFCRPDEKFLELPEHDFIWKGYDGSEIFAHRAPDHYNSEKGKAGERVKKWIKENNEHQTGLLLWGIGNHGGGPSKEDLEQIRNIAAEEDKWNIQHGTPEEYFESLFTIKDSLNIITRDLNPWAVGCYTSMALIKQKHRLLENIYYKTEKMLANAALQNLIDYPHEELKLALEDLLFGEFHDIFPGSSIPEVESYALQRFDHGLEILSRLKAKAFFKLLYGQKPAKDGEFPFFVYNPHPFDVNETVVCEFQPPEPNFNRDVFWMPELFDNDGNKVTVQLEKESCNIQNDHRKRVVFNAQLKASSMNRFSCFLKEVEPITSNKLKQDNVQFRFVTDTSKISINKKTGLIDEYKINGEDYLNKQSFKPLIIKDYADPWGMKVRSFRDVEGSFKLMNKKESAEFAGVSEDELEPVRIIEDGPLRTIVEALMKYNNSALCLKYQIPKNGSEIEIELRVYWMEKDKMLKLSIPTYFPDSTCKGQVAYGVEDFNNEDDELVAQKWVAVVSADQKKAVTVINDGTYGFDFQKGELRLSLLRSPAYSGHPVDDTSPIVRQDRFEPRIDQGERIFKFWINGGNASDRLERIDRESLIKNETPMVLCCYPSGSESQVYQGVTLSDQAVQISALKMAENKNQLIIRLFEPTGIERKTNVRIPFLNMDFEVHLKVFEIKSIAVDIHTKAVFTVDLLERKLNI